MEKLTGILTCVTLLCIINTAQCQTFMSPVEQELRQNLTKLVQFVVDPSASISEDLVNFALAAGGEPRTQEERQVYIGMLKKIAKATPNAMKNFTTTTTLADGTVFETVDELSLDAHLTQRGMEYVQKQQDAATVNSVTVNTSNTGGINAASASVPNTGGINTASASVPNTNNMNNAQFGQTGGSVSLLDIFRMNDFNNNANGLFI